MGAALGFSKEGRGHGGIRSPFGGSLQALMGESQLEGWDWLQGLVMELWQGLM